jgi:hypothetical protein
MFGDTVLKGSDVLSELGLRDGDSVRLLHGGFKLLGGISSAASSTSSNEPVEHFADVNRPGVKSEWAEHSPKWLTCTPGLCLQGTCSNEDCVAYN